jgi:hypothetical protein
MTDETLLRSAHTVSATTDLATPSTLRQWRNEREAFPLWFRPARRPLQSSSSTLCRPRTEPCPGISAHNEEIVSAFRTSLASSAANYRDETVADHMRAVVETLWPDLVHKLPPT